MAVIAAEWRKLGLPGIWLVAAPTSIPALGLRGSWIAVSVRNVWASARSGA